MRRGRGRQEQLAGLFVVVGATVVFAPVSWLLRRWSLAVARDPADAFAARWLGEHLSAHPHLTGAALLLGVMLSGGLIMLILVSVAKRLAARLTNGARWRQAGSREQDP
jgi:hypothetical protein